MSSSSDFLVIGTGAAGLSFALRAAEHGRVTILTKKKRADANTNYAQGGIAAVLSAEDSYEKHIQDTMKAGVGLCFEEAVQIIAQEGPERIQDLENWGVKFTYKPGSSTYDLGREGGHSMNRIVHVKDKTGFAVEMKLLARVMEHPAIEVYENYSVVELITEHHINKNKKNSGENKNCWGVYALDTKTNMVKTFLAKVTLLATGGSGQVYLHTSNPSIATGDGIAMCYRAGVTIANLEFMQFHPTTLYHPKADSFLISEAVRGFGGILRTKDGKQFMKDYHPQAELAPRDVVARAIDKEMKKRGEESVYLDVTHLDARQLRDHFPQINEKLLSFKIDLTRELIPVVPAAHYMCGGVLTNLEGQTSLRGLYATGEAACTGVHGANRLASNSLLEALVFSRRAYESAVQFIQKKTFDVPPIPQWDDKGTFDQEEWVLIAHDRYEIQKIMWDYVGIVRSDLRLARAERRVRMIAEEIENFFKKTTVTPPLLELRNLATVALKIIQCAQFRKESRGLHYTTDHPQKDDQHWLGNTIIKKDNLQLKSFPEAIKNIR
jgi:L-aspartate oxidase